jgi:hypothetical protein
MVTEMCGRVAFTDAPDLRRSQTDGAGSTNYGPHDSNIANKLDPHYVSDRDHRANPVSVTHDQGSTNYGPHPSNLGNKLDPRYDSDLDNNGSAFNTQGSTNYGPHSTNVGNKLDPRYDSDQDHRGRGMHDVDQGTVGFEGAAQDSATRSYHSHVANTGRTVGTDGFSSGAHHITGGGHTMEVPSVYGHTNSDGRFEDPNVASGSHGPHASEVLNKLDPRIDSSTGTKRLWWGNWKMSRISCTVFHIGLPHPNITDHNLKCIVEIWLTLHVDARKPENEETQNNTSPSYPQSPFSTPGSQFSPIPLLHIGGRQGRKETYSDQIPTIGLATKNQASVPLEQGFLTLLDPTANNDVNAYEEGNLSK